MPHKKTTVGPFESLLGRPKPLTAKQRATRKRTAEYARATAAEKEFDRRRRESQAAKPKPARGGKPTAAQVQSKRAEERRARATRGTFLERLTGIFSTAAPPKPPKKRN